ncbi:MAG: hypothetical protein MUC94_17190 [bacterium]|nr:hypothetical protein [bacterium]
MSALKNETALEIYRSKGSKAGIEVRVESETVWLTAHQMAEIFGVDRTGIVRHINNIYRTKELPKVSTCAKNAQVAADGKVRQMDFYSLDMIDVGISILPMKSLQMQMSSGVPYYEGELYNVIRQGRGVPAVPLVIVGIMP